MKRNFDYVGPAIARLRKERHWTQEDVAMKLWQLGIYMTWQMVANIESCRRVATDIQIYYFAKLFGVSVDSLFRGTRKRFRGGKDKRSHVSKSSSSQITASFAHLRSQRPAIDVDGGGISIRCEGGSNRSAKTRSPNPAIGKNPLRERNK